MRLDAFVRDCCEACGAFFRRDFPRDPGCYNSGLPQGCVCQLASGRDAWKDWDAVVRAAKGVQAHTEHGNFTAYLEDCVTQATAERNKYPAP